MEHPGRTEALAQLRADTVRDGDLDLYVVNYLRYDVDATYPPCYDAGARGYCHPTNFEGARDRLYRGNGDGTFADATDEMGITDPCGPFHGKGLGVVAADFDGDGLIDEGFIAIYEDAGGLDGLFAITPNASSTSERVVVLVENVSDQIRFSFVDPDGVTPGGDANTSGRNGLERGGSEDFRVSFAVMGRLPRSATPEIHSAQRTLKIALRN